MHARVRQTEFTAVQYALVPAKPDIEEGQTLGDSPALTASQSRRALSAFLLFGMLSSALGAFLPAWGYHLDSHFITAGNYFLSLNAGLLIGVRVGFTLLPKKGVAYSMVMAASVACAGFLWLAPTPTNFTVAWRVAGLLLLGFGGGLLNSAAFHAISPLYHHDRAATLTLAGTLYGLGCLITAVLMAGTYTVYTVPAILVLFAAVAAFHIVIFLGGQFPAELARTQLPIRRVLEDFKNPGAVLFALVLFFQFGNEYSIAGWLPIFLIRRLGISPAAALSMLAEYFAALLVGRVAAKGLLNVVSRGKLLIGSILLACFGCFVLTFTANRFGAIMGTLFVGAGFASIYPLVAEKIGHRFRYYHPGLYNGIFSFAVTGGLLAPCILGYLAQWLGVGVVLLLPMLGTVIVFVLLLLIILESKLSGGNPGRTPDRPPEPVKTASI